MERGLRLSAPRSRSQSTSAQWDAISRIACLVMADCEPPPTRQFESAARGERPRQRGLPFFINARTDVFFQRPPEQHDEGMITEVLERTKRYRDAGADGLFVPGLIDCRLIAKLAAASPLPVNILCLEGAPPLNELANHGVARVSYGPEPYLLAMRALEAAARAVSGS